jgi:circadian clock protein KaiC
MAKSKMQLEKQSSGAISKTLTGISGLDEITLGGIPTGRPTLICGEAGSGKTLFSIEFIVRGALYYNEPGVFMAFEEKADELKTNVASLGFDLDKLEKDKKSDSIMYISTAQK